MEAQLRCIVIGASAGGFDVLRSTIAELPADLSAAVLVVMHVSPSERSYLPELLDRAGPLPAFHPADGSTLEVGNIYVAPPDHHLLLDNGFVLVKRGPKENGFRPSIDALFRSAAYSHGQNVIGVVLSGALHDGTSGIWTIKRLGGIAIVQDPAEAHFESMPRSALEYVDADYKVRAADLAPLLTRLASETSTGDAQPRIAADIEERIAKEVQIAAAASLPQESVIALGELTPFTCPECQGALVNIVEGEQTRFRCHTGHAFSDDALLRASSQKTGNMIWQVARGLQETIMLLKHIGRHLESGGEPDRARKFFAKAAEMEKRASNFQQLAIHHESLSRDILDPPGIKLPEGHDPEAEEG